MFCPECGTLLNLPADNENTVECDQCRHVEPASCMPFFHPFCEFNLPFVLVLAFEGIEIVTESHPDAFPSALRQARKTQTRKIDSLDAMEKVRSLETVFVFLLGLMIL